MRARHSIFLAVALVHCGTRRQPSPYYDDDAGEPDASLEDALGLVDSGLDSGDASCGFGSAGSFATQTSLDLFGQTVFFADGGTLPAGHYQITYVDGCMKYSNANQDWTVNAYGEDAGTNDHWYLVDGYGGDAGTTLILMPPGTIGYTTQNGAYATFSECVMQNLMLDKPRDFDFDGGKLGLWLGDSPYSDNVAGDNGRNPKWSLTLIGQPCPNPN